MTHSITALHHYAKCCIYSIVILNVIMLSVVMLNVIMLNVVMLNVVAPRDMTIFRTLQVCNVL